MNGLNVIARHGKGHDLAFKYAHRYLGSPQNYELWPSPTQQCNNSLQHDKFGAEHA